MKTDEGHYLLIFNDSENHRYPLVLSMSTNGIEWSNKMVLENTPGEFSYPSICVNGLGEIHLLYTHYRKNIKHIILTKEETKKIMNFQ